MNTVEIGSTTERQGPDGRFKEGNSGRVKGSQNKRTQKIREFLDKNLGEMQAIYDDPATEKKLKVTIYLGLMPYGYPRMQAITDVDGNDIQQHQQAQPLPPYDFRRLTPAAQDEIVSMMRSTGSINYVALSPETLNQIISQHGNN